MSKKLKIAAISSAVAVASIFGAGVVYSVANAEKGSADTSAANTSDVVNSSVAKSSDSSSKLVDENVYVYARTDGSVRKIVSSDWTKTLDVDEYTNFQTDDKKLPIDMKVSYKLDGEDISAKDLVGKKGRVTIRYEFTNKEKASGYYVPYAVISGLILDNNHFTNVETKNAKLINDGTRTIIAGIMLPGMQENLGISNSTFEIPSSFEVSADATDFELGMSVSIATNEVFKDLGLSSVDSLDQLTASINKMSDAMSQLVGGSSDLAKGIETLYEKASALPAGVAALSDGANQLKDGSSQLAAGTNALNAGAEGMYNSINGMFVSKNTKLQSGASQILTGLLVSFYPNLAPVLTSCNITQNDFIFDYGHVKDNACFIATATAVTEVGQAKGLLDGMYGLKDGITDYTNGVEELNECGIKGSTAKYGQDSKCVDLASNSLIPGTAKLAAGANSLATGASRLSDGLGTLNASTPALIDGIEQLRDGSAKLSSGIKQFNDEAIQKLVSIYNNDVKGLINKLRDIADVAKNNSKNTKYIYRTDEIKK